MESVRSSSPNGLEKSIGRLWWLVRPLLLVLAAWDARDDEDEADELDR